MIASSTADSSFDVAGFCRFEGKKNNKQSILERWNVLTSSFLELAWWLNFSTADLSNMICEIAYYATYLKSDDGFSLTHLGNLNGKLRD